MSTPDIPTSSTPSGVSLTLDITDLESATSFWTAALTGHVRTREKPGTLGEQRVLVFDDAPGLSLRLRWCWPRATVGTTPGGIREIEVAVDDPGAVRARIESCEGVSVTQEPGEGCGALKLVDSQGYAVVFRGRA
ncbi:MAG: hypothetical protein AAGI30_11990 [Planctomycetota bacterium]